MSDGPATVRPLGHPPADSLMLAIANAVIALLVRVLEVTGSHWYGVFFVGNSLLNPALAFLTLIFGVRDLGRGRGWGVATAALLTLVALGLSWWPLLVEG